MAGLQKVAGQGAPALGIMADVKVDKGTTPLPFSDGGVVTQGLDGLRGRRAGYRELGAVFAKWRAVLNITRERLRVRMRGAPVQGSRVADNCQRASQASAAGSPDCAQPLSNERQAVREERRTLTRYTIESEHRHPGSTGDFSGLLNAVATAVKIISNQVNRGALAGALGSAGAENVQGEVQKKLDLISNEVMIGETEWAGHLAAMASEEMEDIYPVPPAQRRGKYLLVFDPLDGSSNLDANISVGTIFSILRSPDPGAEPRAEHFLQPGTAQVCAGFALYGPSTMLILTTGEGVDGFTPDRDIGAFILTHPQLRIPEDCGEFAINASNERFWEPPVRRYIQECLAAGTSTCAGLRPWWLRRTASSPAAVSSCTPRTARSPTCRGSCG